MDEKIHQILKDAGAANGITADEVKMLFVLGNDDLFSNFLGVLRQSLSPEDFENVKSAFESEKENIKNAQDEYAQGLEGIVGEVKTDIFEEKLKKFSKIHPKDVLQLEKELSAI